MIVIPSLIVRNPCTMLYSVMKHRVINYPSKIKF